MTLAQFVAFGREFDGRWARRTTKDVQRETAALDRLGRKRKASDATSSRGARLLMPNAVLIDASA